jgi:hypothetical protein
MRGFLSAEKVKLSVVRTGVVLSDEMLNCFELLRLIAVPTNAGETRKPMLARPSDTIMIRTVGVEGLVGQLRSGTGCPPYSLILGTPSA